MQSTINNSYTRAALSGLITSTIPEFSNRSLPISLTTAISLIVGKTFNHLSKSLETNRKALDECISKLTAPAIFMVASAYILNDKTNSGPLIDIPALALGLMATNTKAIQPIMRFIAPVQSTYTAMSALQQIPLLKHYPSLLKISATYGISSLAAQSMQNSLEATETLPFCEKFAITTFLSFAAIDLYPAFSSAIAGFKNFLIPILASSDEQEANPIENFEFDLDALEYETELPDGRVPNDIFTPLSSINKEKNSTSMAEPTELNYTLPNLSVTSNFTNSDSDLID